jgi:hypothetical protein
MLESAPQKMTEKQRTYRQRKTTLGQSPVVIVLIVACSLSLSAYMIFGSQLSSAADEQATGSEETQTDDNSGQTGDGTEPQEAYEDVVIGEYRAVSQGSDSARASNIELATSAINGITIAPNASFSFNDTIGSPDLDERYQEAPIVYGDTMRQEIGGGICQVSTALYIASLYAGMTIDERHPHSIVVDYAPIGLDATLVFDTMDLRITNPYEYPVRITAEAEGQAVIVKLEGHALEDGLFIDPVSKIVEHHVAGAPYTGTDDELSALQDKEYYIVETYRLYYLDGFLTNTELLAIDRYLLSDDSVVMATEGGVAPSK